MSNPNTGHIDNMMHESRLFPPSPEFSAQARIKSEEEYQQLWDEAKADPEAFWDKLAKEELHWFEPYTEVLKW
ncbi:MAG: acetyl-coenzyme A synthetase N-terminal domain-containing protein, partial [Pirellulaceae bacterium]